MAASSLAQSHTSTAALRSGPPSYPACATKGARATYSLKPSVGGPPAGRTGSAAGKPRSRAARRKVHSERRWWKGLVTMRTEDQLRREKGVQVHFSAWGELGFRGIRGHNKIGITVVVGVSYQLPRYNKLMLSYSGI